MTGLAAAMDTQDSACSRLKFNLDQVLRAEYVHVHVHVHVCTEQTWGGDVDRSNVDFMCISH